MIGIQDEMEYCRDQIMRNQVNDPQAVCDTIREVCEDIANMLCAKNAAYGNSAIDPVRIFSKASPIEQINVRCDDKLSRISRGHSAGEDTEIDLIGYLILKQVFYKLHEV